MDTCPFIKGRGFLVTYAGKCSEKRNLCTTTCLDIMEKGLHVTYARKFSQLVRTCVDICLFIKWKNFLVAHARQCSQEGTVWKDMYVFIMGKIFLLTYARKRLKYKDLILVTENHLKIEYFIVIYAKNISKWSLWRYICLFIMNYLKKDSLVIVAKKYSGKRLIC
jgi:hypothetical protein